MNVKWLWLRRGRLETGRWQEPITFETERLGQYRTIASTAEAARVLADDWPIDAGGAYEDALKTCLAVFKGKQEPVAAREAFLKAAKEAGVFVRP